MKRFSILSHDRGARVAHRLAIDHPERVDRMVLLDIAPTLYMYEQTNMSFVSCPPLLQEISLRPSTGDGLLALVLHATAGTWPGADYFFLATVESLIDKENIMLGRPDLYWAMLGGRDSHKGVRWTQQDIEEYQTFYFSSEGVHAVSDTMSTREFAI